MPFFGVGRRERAVGKTLKQVILGNAAPTRFDTKAATVQVAALTGHLRIYGIAHKHLFAGTYAGINVVNTNG